MILLLIITLLHFLIIKDATLIISNKNLIIIILPMCAEGVFSVKKEIINYNVSFFMPNVGTAASLSVSMVHSVVCGL